MAMFDSDEFVAGCLEASRAADPVSALRLQVERAVADPEPIERRFPVPVDPDDDGILHRSAELLIVSAVFPRGFTTGLHDHSVPAIIGLWAGAEENWLYRRTPNGVELTDSQRVRRGEVIVLDADAIHNVRVSDAGWSGGLHVYLGDILTADRSEWADAASRPTSFDPVDQERRSMVAALATGLVAPSPNPTRHSEASALGPLTIRTVSGCPPSVAALAVVTRQVVDTADGWLAAEGGVAAVMVVEMEPACQVVGGVRLLSGRGGRRPTRRAGCG